MPNQEHVVRLKQGVKAWNEWREANRHIRPLLYDAKLKGMNLSGFDLSSVDLSRADMSDTELSGANFEQAHLISTNLRRSNLASANLHSAKLHSVDFTNANLLNACLSEAVLVGTTFHRAGLQGTNFRGARMLTTLIVDCDLSSVTGLDAVVHDGPSSIGIDTLYESQGKIPDEFLRGVGVPQDFITYAHSLINEPFEFHSCFISYSAKDEEFAKRLHARMRQAGLRVWFAPEDLKGGDKLYDQIDRAIQLHDKLLLALSWHSIQSEWVITEIRKAREVEKRENRRKLFPIRLVDFDALRNWTCFDADSGKDLAIEVREYAMPNDFSSWKDHDTFETAFSRLLKDLRAEESKKA